MEELKMIKEDKPVSKSSKKGVSPSDAGQAARTAANKVRNFSRARAKAKAHQLKPLAVPRGTARAARRDAARPAWQAQEGKPRPLSAFC
jgi:hypothetical protein